MTTNYRGAKPAIWEPTGKKCPFCRIGVMKTDGEDECCCGSYPRPGCGNSGPYRPQTAPGAKEISE